MKRFTNPTLAHADLTSAVHFLTRDLEQVSESANTMLHLGHSVPALHMARLREAHQKLGYVIEQIDNIHDGRAEQAADREGADYAAE